ncbi:MAG: hypothetical protein A2Z34_05400 [Planctomycetes bacterium RBG_16_59_8]|nr:MAG: hypothetical protein A2Z34_05400 [Planctomycetes bacterium RBG_16_59_8]
MKRLSIVIVTPLFFPSVGGNATTVGRWKVGLERAGHIVRVVDGSRAREEIRKIAPPPDVIHCYHAYKSGRHLSDLPEIPMVVSLPGTDIAEDVAVPERREVVERVLGKASIVAASNNDMAVEVARRFPAMEGRIRVLPKGVSLPAGSFGLRQLLGIAPEELVFLFPAGIRRVKNNHYPLERLADLASSLPPFRLVYAGPVLEREYAVEFEERRKRRPWAHCLGAIPYDRMGGLYAEADIVLNCSLHEGLPNALLEAMSLGRAVVASDIAGNRAAVENGVDGLLYRDDGEFRKHILSLAGDAERRKIMGERAREKIRRSFGPERELAALLGIYREAISG